MSRQDVAGHLTAISHMFYLSKENKIFILRLFSHHESEHPLHILCSLSTTLLPITRDLCKTILKSPPLGKLLSISNLKQINLHKNTASEVKALQLTKNSKIHLSHLQEIELPQSCNRLFTYRGIVTHSQPSSGFYILDKAVYMSTSLLCAVTNIPSIPLATTVTVHNAHLAKFKGHKWLTLCGAGFVQLHQELGELQVHPSVEEINNCLANPVINIVQEVGERWTCQEMLLLLDNYKIVDKCYPGNILLDKLLRVSLKAEKSNTSRSLTKEFLNHQHFCSLDVNSDQKPLVRSFLSLEHLRDIIDNNFSEEEEKDHEAEEREIEFEAGCDHPLIIGIVQLDQSGRTVLIDKNSELLMVGNFDYVELGQYLEIQRMTVALEKDNRRCIIVHKFKSLGTFEKISAAVNLTKTEQRPCSPKVRTCLVVAKSSVMKDVAEGSLYFLIICDDREEGKIILKFSQLMKYFLIKQTKKLAFSNRNSCFKKIEHVSSREFEAQKVVGQVPWFEVKADTNIDIAEEDVATDIPAYTLTNPEEIPNEELVNIVATVVSKNIEDEAKSGSKNPLDQVCKIHLILTDRHRHESSQYSFYLSVPTYPLGLAQGTMVEVTSVIKTVSKKGQTYFHSTHFTSINFLSTIEHIDESAQPFSLSSLQNPCIGISGMVELLVSLEKVVSLVVMVECGGCNSTIVNGRCSYIGCNVAPNHDFTFKATFEILSVDTFATLVSLVEEDIKTILNCSTDDWKKVKEEATLTGKTSLKGSLLLPQVTASALATADSFCLRARRFTGQVTDRQPVKLFCLKAWRLQTMQINYLFEQILGL